MTNPPCTPPEADTIDQPITLAYGPERSLVGELRHATERSLGMVMLIHGGFWRPHRDLSMTRPLATHLSARGFDTWNIEYRRTSHATWQDTLSDIAAAADYTRILAEQHGTHRHRLLLLGHSAGGQLAAWCAGRAAHPHHQSRPVPPVVSVSGLVTVGGLLDLTTGARDGTGRHAVSAFLGGGPDDVPAPYAAADPLQRLPINVPTRCVHSVHDERVPFQHSARYAETARFAGDDVRLVEATGTHTDAITPGHRDTDRVVTAVIQLATAVYRDKKCRRSTL